MWLDNWRKCLIHYGVLKLYVTHGLVVEKILETNSFIQSRRLEKNISFNTQKRSTTKTDFEKDFYWLFDSAFYQKTKENIRTPIKLEFFEKYEDKKIIKQLISQMKTLIVIQSSKMKF